MCKIDVQISNPKLCETSECRVYSAVKHPWWMCILLHRRGLTVTGSAHVTFGGSGGIMTNARSEFVLPM